MRFRQILDFFVELGFLVSASNDKLAASIADEVGCELPSGLHEYWSNYDPVEGCTIDGWYLVPARNCQVHRQMMSDAANRAGSNALELSEEFVVGPLRAVYWHDKWIPLLVSEHVMVCVDLDPEIGGVAGQILFLNDDGEDRVVLFDSIEAMFRNIFESFNRGSLTLESEDGIAHQLESTNPEEPLFYPS